MKIRTRGRSQRSGPRNAWTRIENVNGASRLSKFWNFFGAIQKISCSDWWPWTKPGYITMTRRQSKNQWSDSIAAHPSPKNSECKNPLEKFSPRLFEITTASSSLIIFQMPNYQRGVLLISGGAIEIHFEGKTPREGHQGGLVLARQYSGSPGICNPEETGLPGWASSVLITHPILRIWPRRTTTSSLDWKKHLKGRNFSSDAEVIVAGETWLDGQPSEFECLAKVIATG